MPGIIICGLIIFAVGVAGGGYIGMIVGEWQGEEKERDRYIEISQRCMEKAALDVSIQGDSDYYSGYGQAIVDITRKMLGK